MDFNINKLNFEKSLLNITVNPVKLDKFKGFQQFAENKLKEEEKEQEDKEMFKSKLRKMISMRNIGSILGFRRQSNADSQTNSISQYRKSQAHLLSVRFKRMRTNTMTDVNEKIEMIKKTEDFALKGERLILKRPRSLYKVKEDLYYYESRLRFLRQVFFLSYHKLKSKRFKEVLRFDRDNCELEKSKLLAKKDVDQDKKLKTIRFVNTWKDKIQLIKRKSRYRNFKSYTLKQVIIKGGDDLRQEMMAMQLMKIFNKAFKEENTNCYLQPYDITATSSSSGFLEFLTDSMPIDALKKTHKTTLLEIYECMFGDRFETARKNFIQSLAGYSLYCYLLQIKDRHNGNILVSLDGHVLHIDFGFMFTTSPGNINFENAPFKLTTVS